MSDQKRKGDPGYKSQRERFLKRRYGISIAEFNAILEAQGGGCGFCGTQERKDARGRERLYVDHNHLNGARRMIICPRCNYLLGFVEASPGLVQKMLDYAGREQAEKMNMATPSGMN